MSRARPVVLGLAALTLVVAGLLPIGGMVLRSVTIDGHFGFEAYRGLLDSGRGWTLAGNALVLATMTTIFSLALGIPLGFLIGRTDLPGRRILGGLLAMPLVLPPYLTAVGWIGGASENGLPAALLGVDAARALGRILFGLPGCVLVLTTAFMPLVMLLVAAGLRGVPSRLEEAARIVAPWPVVVRRVSLPLILPGVLLGGALVFLLALGDVTVAPTFRFPVFAVEILSRFSAFYDLDAATAAAMPLASVTALVLVLEVLAVRKIGARSSSISPEAGAGRTIPLGRFRLPVTVAAWSVAAGLVGIPVAVLVTQAGGVESYLEAMERAADALARGLGLAVAGGAFLALEGFLLAVLVWERPRGVGAAVDAAALFLFALPGSVIGVSLIVLWNRPSTNWIYATPLILFLGYLARNTAITLRISRASLESVPPGLVEAARVAGIGWGRRLLWIVAPSARRGIAAAWLAGAVFCLRDVSTTLLVHPPGWDTLSVRIMTLAANGAPNLIAALCVMLIAATVVPVGLLVALFGRMEVFR